MVGSWRKEVSDVMLAALDGFVPDYELEVVVATVQAIATAGLREEAEAICKKFVEKGSSVLNKTYQELRAQQT